MPEMWLRLSQYEQLAAMVVAGLILTVVLGLLMPTGRKAFWSGFAVGIAFVIWKTWPAYYNVVAGPYPADLVNRKLLVIGIGAGQLLLAGGLAGLAARLGFGLKNRKSRRMG